MKVLKSLIIKICSIIIRIFYMFPIKSNRISLLSYHGNGYNCNPKAISDYLNINYPECELVWGFNNVDKFKDIMSLNMKAVRFKSIKYIYYVMTSKVRITNAEEWIVLPKRRGQLVINTWHGSGAYKKYGLDSAYVRDKLNGNDYYGSTSMFLAGCKAAAKTYRSAFNYKGKIMKSGFPRNDMLFNTDVNKTRLLKKLIGAAFDEKIVLYAPTFRERGKDNLIPMDGEKILKALYDRFGGKWKLLYRSHLAANLKRGAYLYCKGLGEYIDVSEYDDMQELLYISDILITDYSSSIWDFSLTYRPIFLYVPDLDEYISHERGFYFDIYTWGFPVCKTNQMMVKEIEVFDENNYKLKIMKHHDTLTSYEKGVASEKVCRYINNYIMN